MAAYSYEFRVKGLQKVSAQVVGEVCEELQNSAEGLTARSLLDASRDMDAPLHNEFEWDDGIAAENYRIEQARKIITNLRIVRSDDDIRTSYERPFVSVKRDGTAYTPIMVAVSTPDMRKQLLNRAKNDMEVFVEKYHRLQELAGVVNPMREYLKKVV